MDTGKGKKKERGKFWSGISAHEIVCGTALVSAAIFISDENGVGYFLFEKYGALQIWVALGALILMGISIFLRRHFFDILRLPYLNISDEIVIIAGLSSGIVIVIETLNNTLYTYKKYVALVVLGLCGLTILIRYIFCFQKRKSASLKQHNSVDLAEFILEENRDKWNGDNPIIFSEEDVYYDLLGREGLVNVIINSVYAVATNRSHVIGIKGAWGSGKTTVLNMVKIELKATSEDLVIIDEFDPWVFGTQESLLVALYDEILHALGLKYSVYSSNAVKKSIRETISDSNQVAKSLFSFIDFEKSNYEVLKDIKRELKTLLEQLDKKIVFFIDNIERAESENIIFLFKLIGAVFDLPNIIYIISYDPERLNEIFEKTARVHPKYIDKIINQELCVPAPPRETIAKIGRVCIGKVLLYYGEEKNIEDYASVFDLICENVQDLREYKRLMNTVFITTFKYDNMLYKPHLLALETIRFMRPELYNTIKNNAIYFASEDILFSRQGYRYINDEEFNKEGKHFFEKLFEDNEIFLPTLSEMFPYVKRYKSKQNLREKYWSEEDHSQNRDVASISSFKYFDLYFSYGMNSFLRIDSDVENFIISVNSVNEKDVEKETMNVISGVANLEQQEWFARLQNKIKKIDIRRRVFVAQGICDSLIKLNQNVEFGILSVDQRALLIVTLLLRGADSVPLERLIEACTRNYSISILEEIKLNCQSFIKRGEDYQDLFEVIDKRLNEMCTEIIEKGINIYDDGLYRRRQIWTLYRYYKDNNVNVIYEYMQKCINNRTVFRILSDMIQESTGTAGFGYFIKNDYIAFLFADESIIEKTLAEVEAKTEEERFILGIWKNNRGDGIAGEKDVTYYSKTPVKLDI